MPFESDLELRHRPGQACWELIRSLHYRCSDASEVIVPAGYLSDLASVPQLVRQIVDPQTPAARRPAVVHDFIYTHLGHRFTKRQADLIFYQALLEEGMHRCLAWLVWRAVRLGGQGTWKQ